MRAEDTKELRVTLCRMNTESCTPLAVLSHSQLLNRFDDLVHRDRRCTAEMLGVIAKIDHRKLWAEQACSSMFAFCVERFCMSEAVAAKRIGAARTSPTTSLCAAALTTNTKPISISAETSWTAVGTATGRAACSSSASRCRGASHPTIHTALADTALAEAVLTETVLAEPVGSVRGKHYTRARAPYQPMHPLPSPSVQLITGAWRNADDLENRVRSALRGGIRWVQLRAKDRDARDLHEAASRLAPLLRNVGGLFIVNDRVDVALACGAGGVHLPENGMTSIDARRLLGAQAWIARSVHSVDAIDASSPVDAFQFGPVFDTASKRAFGAPQGLPALRNGAAVAARAGFPLIAVGAITPEKSEECRAQGASAVAVIGSIWDAQDVEAAARRWVSAWPDHQR